MKCLLQGLLTLTLLFTYPALSCTHDGTEGFLPENDLKISVDAKRLGGITEEQFEAQIDKVADLYAPIISSMGATLKVVRNWKDGTVNAFARQIGKTWEIQMFGGLARHETITEDGFALVVCHEIGHHIGGAPKKGTSWASNEGQADYFATLKCLRRAWMNENSTAVVRRMRGVPAALKKACAREHYTFTDQAICIRGGMAGLSVSKLFQALRREAKEPKFDTPDPRVVRSTDHNHPGTQCRMDTYFQGALCEVAFNEDVSNASEVTGTCHGSLGHSIGLRPLCWFKPSVE